MNSIDPLENSLLKMLFGIKTETELDSTSKRTGTGIRIPEPDFSTFDNATKTEAAMSEEEYEKAIVEQAKEDAAKGICGGESAGYKSLMESYVSVVSPDRKGMIAKAPKYLIPEESRTTYLDIRDSSNTLIASYSENTGWKMIMTKAEGERTSKFGSMYMDAWGEAYFGKDNSSNNDNDGTKIMGSIFNVLG